MAVTSVQPGSESRTFLQLAGSAACAAPSAMKVNAKVVMTALRIVPSPSSLVFEDTGRGALPERPAGDLYVFSRDAFRRLAAQEGDEGGNLGWLYQALLWVLGSDIGHRVFEG